MTLALRGLATPVAYCEVDPFCVAVLRARMADGGLPRAPVCPDVADMSAAWLRRHMHTPTVDVILAGFPCQGFSVTGRKAGFDHAGSGLFRHILRLADELRPPLLILENVPNILRGGNMDRVVRALVRDRGYTLRWAGANMCVNMCACRRGVLGADQVGAPHHRRRWFCLAVRLSSPSPSSQRTIARLQAWAARHRPRALGFPAWARRFAPLRRMVIDQHERRQRCAALGNAVVPAAVRRAVWCLVGATTTATPKTNLWPPWGTAEPTGDNRVLADPKVVRSIPPPRPVFDPRHFRDEARRRKTTVYKSLELDHRPHHHRFWATPMHGNTAASRRLSRRTVWDLPTQVRFEQRTPDRVRGGQISAEFVVPLGVDQ